MEGKVWETQLGGGAPSHSRGALAAGERRRQDTYAHVLWFTPLPPPPSPNAAVNCRVDAGGSVSVGTDQLVTPVSPVLRAFASPSAGLSLL